MEIKCKRCGNDIPGAKRGRSYCSECKKISVSEAHQKSVEARRNALHPCATCGTPVDGFHTYCPKCRTKRRATQHDDSRQRERLKAIRKLLDDPLSRDVSKLMEHNAARQAAGYKVLSYGNAKQRGVI